MNTDGNKMAFSPRRVDVSSLQSVGNAYLAVLPYKLFMKGDKSDTVSEKGCLLIF